MVITASILASVLLTAVPAEKFPIVSENFASLFEAREHTYTGGRYQQQSFRYRLFVPRNLQPEERCPLLVWLHGCRENGSDNRDSLRWLDMILRDREHLEKYRFFILVTQCPDKTSFDDDNIELTFDILQNILREQPVDQDRIYVSGVSGGGSGTWRLAELHSDTFAAIVPMAGSSRLSDVASLSHLPIWGFHNCLDWNFPYEQHESTAAAVQEAGGNVHLTLLTSHGHDCWDVALQEYQVMDWMLAQRRGQAICWTPPGCRAWRWWHVLGGPAAYVVIVGLGWYSERKRRQRRRSLVKKKDDVATTPPDPPTLQEA